jgi:hypothetical protein
MNLQKSKKTAQQNAQWKSRILLPFLAFFLASSFLCSQVESTPAPAPQPAGHVRDRKPLGAVNNLEWEIGFILISPSISKSDLKNF